LISFFILRTPGDDPHSSQDELSLIPFPTQEIFQEQLKTFDLVIFQNFNHRPTGCRSTSTASPRTFVKAARSR